MVYIKSYTMLIRGQCFYCVPTTGRRSNDVSVYWNVDETPLQIPRSIVQILVYLKPPCSTFKLEYIVSEIM